MKRRQTFNIAGHAHELTFSCLRRSASLNSDRSRAWLISAMIDARRKHGIRFIAAVIHARAHPHPPPPDTRRSIRPHPHRHHPQGHQQPVAQRAMACLKKHDAEFLERIRVVKKSGTFEHRLRQLGGGDDRTLWSVDALGRAVESIHLNPVRRKLWERPIEWQWSSARWYAGHEDVELKMDLVPPNL